MPANRTVASLSIALIVFVMLTFVLAITTYLFFKQRLDEQQKAEAAAAETAKARTDLNVARDEKRKLQEILGASEEKTIDQIEAETTARFAGEFAAFDAEPKTFLKLVDWLGEALRKKDEQMDSRQVDHEKAVADLDRALEAQKAAVERAVAAKEAVEKDAASEKQKFDQARQVHQQQQEKLTTGERKAFDQSTAFDKLKAEVAKGSSELEKYLPAKAREFRAKQDDPEGQLDTLYEALRMQGNVIRQQNELLARLRVADTAQQAAVDAATPKDDRIDGFDGRVIAVDEAERTALISCSSTQGMRPGLLLSVYDPKDPQPQSGARKGLLEVIAVESPTVARTRIRRDSISTPILGGDGVATNLWAPGQTLEVVVVGFVQLDNDAEADLETLRAAVERAGGRVVDGVTPSTAIVVDGGVPKVAGGGKASGWRPTDVTRRDGAIKSARGLGIRVVGIKEMLDMLGMEREDLGGGRLPTRGDDGRSLPRRSAGVSY